MIKYEPPYVVHLLEGVLASIAEQRGVVYSSGNPEDAEAFASSLHDAGGAVVEVRDSGGRLVRRFARPATQPS
jgi:(2Fe-2S) ferredoxin